MKFPSILHKVCISLLKFSPSPPFLKQISAFFVTVGHIRSVCKEAQSDLRLQSLYSHHRAGIPVSSDDFFSVLRVCAKSKDLMGCKRLHALAISIGFSPWPSELHHSLIHLFAQCGALLDANLAFSEVEEPNFCTWFVIVSAHAVLEESQAALVLYFRMLDEGWKPNKSLFLCALKACSNIGALQHGRLIHRDILRNGMEPGVVVGTIFVNFYAKCGCLEDARVVFENLSSKNVVTWGALIAGYTQH
eukprot:c41141_g1_i1 orf=253-993(+)